MKNFRPQTAKKAQCSSCLLDTQLQLIVNTFLCVVPCYFFSLFLKTTQCPSLLSVSCLKTPLTTGGSRQRFLLVQLQKPPSETAAVAPNWPAESKKAGGSPLVGPLFGGVVRSDDLRLRHHSVLILREGVAMEQVLLHGFRPVQTDGALLKDVL